MNLTQEQKKNLQIFLSRVTLNGSEVGAFNELVNAIFAEATPINDVPEDKPKKK
jgi:hypothetical protein